MGEDTNLNASINAFEGGYLVTIGARQIIVTSLNKAIKTVRDYLGGSSQTEGE